MSNESKRTPGIFTKWRLDPAKDLPPAVIEDTEDGHGVLELEGRTVKSTARGLIKAHNEAIVRACNSHEAQARIVALVARFAKEGASSISLSALMDDSDTETLGEAALKLANATR